jgi:hypothetical protein
MAGALFLPPYPEFRDDDGSPLADGTIEFYLSGTSTPEAVHEDEDRSVSLTEVVSLDSAGRPKNASDAQVSIWIDANLAYKVVVKRAAGTIVRTVDPYRQGDPNRTGLAREEYASDGALTVLHGLHKLTKSSAGAYTLSNPTSDEEGTVMHIRAQTAFAHTVTVTGGYAGAGAGADVATCGGAVGDGFTIIAVNSLWHIVSLQNVTLS